MKTISCLLIVLTVAVPAWAAPGVTLENAAVRVEWDAGSGAMIALRDKASGREWLAPAAAQSGYSVQLVDQAAPATAAGAKAVRVRRQEGVVVIEADHEKPVPFSVTCRFWLEKDSPCILSRIAVRAASPVRIAEVGFPLVTLRLPFSGSGEQDELLLPYCDGYVIRDPLKNLFERRCNYPGAASMQMMAAYDPAAGIYLAGRDGECHAKTLWARQQRGKGLELGILHQLPQVPVVRWELGFDVALAGLRRGAGPVTWETAADLYRQWAVRQPWCRQTLAQRVAAGDVPRWIVEPSLFLTYSLRGQTPDGTPGDRLPMAAEQIERWSKLVGAPVTCLIMSWEKHDTWVSPDYFPPYGGEAALSRLTERLHAGGHRTLVFLSGLNWTLHKDLAGPDRPRVVVDDEAAFNRRGRPFAISDARGQAVISGEATKGVGQHAIICPATPLARELLLDAALGCQRLGIDCVQVDQIVGGGMAPCFHPRHAHAAGGGNWSAQAIYRLFAEIRKAGKARSADFAFSIEEPGEFYLPLLDTYHARDLHQGRWPRSGAGVLGVPLFTHVYHDYLAGYGSEGCYISDRPNRFCLYQIGMNLVCGKTPAVALWGRWLEPERVDATQVRLLRAHLALWRGAAGEFLVYGQRVATPELAVPSLELVASEKDGKTRRTLSVPAVLQGTYRLADNRRATLFACIADQPVTFTAGNKKITLEPGQAALEPSPR